MGSLTTTPLDDQHNVVIPAPRLVYAQNEVSPYNDDADCLIGYFDGDRAPTQHEVDALFNNQAELCATGRLVIASYLSWTVVDFDYLQRSTELAQHAKLQRYVLGYCS